MPRFAKALPCSKTLFEMPMAGAACRSQHSARQNEYRAECRSHGPSSWMRRPRPPRQQICRCLTQRGPTLGSSRRGPGLVSAEEYRMSLFTSSRYRSIGSVRASARCWTGRAPRHAAACDHAAPRAVPPQAVPHPSRQAHVQCIITACGDRRCFSSGALVSRARSCAGHRAGPRLARRREA
jgi:hypothetical protein